MSVPPPLSDFGETTETGSDFVRRLPGRGSNSLSAIGSGPSPSRRRTRTSADTRYSPTKTCQALPRDAILEHLRPNQSPQPTQIQPKGLVVDNRVPSRYRNKPSGHSHCAFLVKLHCRTIFPLPLANDRRPYLTGRDQKQEATQDDDPQHATLHSPETFPVHFPPPLLQGVPRTDSALAHHFTSKAPP